MMIWSRVNGHRNGMSACDFLDWQQQSKSFQHLAAWTDSSFNLATQTQPEQYQRQANLARLVQHAGDSFPDGSGFSRGGGSPRQRPCRHPYDKLWNRLGAKCDLIGQTIRINGSPHTVVGTSPRASLIDSALSTVRPAGVPPGQINCVFPLSLASNHGAVEAGRHSAAGASRYGCGHGSIANSYPDSNKGWGAAVEPLKNDFLP